MATNGDGLLDMPHRIWLYDDDEDDGYRITKPSHPSPPMTEYIRAPSEELMERLQEYIKQHDRFRGNHPYGTPADDLLRDLLAHLDTE